MQLFLNLARLVLGHFCFFEETNNSTFQKTKNVPERRELNLKKSCIFKKIFYKKKFKKLIIITILIDK